MTNHEDTYAVDYSPEYWWLNEDGWGGGAGSETEYVCPNGQTTSASESGYEETSVDNQPSVDGGAVELAPQVEYDVGGRGDGSSCVNNTAPLSSFTGITSTYSESFPHNPGDNWDAGYDLWTDCWTNETMVWNQWDGGQSYWYTADGVQDVTIGSVAYHFCDNNGSDCVNTGSQLDNGNELIFMAVNQSSSGSVDLLAIWQWEVANGYASTSDIPTQLEYTAEICETTTASGAQGAETFPENDVTFDVAS
jgi:hypothetical protein